jgi:hypothetical protein
MGGEEGRAACQQVLNKGTCMHQHYLLACRVDGIEACDTCTGNTACVVSVCTWCSD